MEIKCETSMRHVHLCKKDVEALFGKGAKLESERELSQPGQFLCKQRVNLVGPTGSMNNVGIIGPERTKSQIEISRTDAFTLGLKDVPLRQSGDLEGAPLLVILSPDLSKQVIAPAIIAKRHVHLDPDTAKKHNITDGQVVKIKIEGERGAVLDQTIARIDKSFKPAVHLDSDEANAVLAGNTVTVVKR